MKLRVIPDALQADATTVQLSAGSNTPRRQFFFVECACDLMILFLLVQASDVFTASSWVRISEKAAGNEQAGRVAKTTCSRRGWQPWPESRPAPIQRAVLTVQGVWAMSLEEYLFCIRQDLVGRMS